MLKIFSFIALFSVIFFSVPTISLAATFTTLDATDRGPYMAKLNGSFTGVVDTVWFKYNTKETDLSNITPARAASPTGSYGTILNGLTKETKYYFKFCGLEEDSLVEKCGSTLNFTTAGVTEYIILPNQDQSRGGEIGEKTTGGDWCVVKVEKGKNVCESANTADRYSTEEDCIADKDKTEEGKAKTCSQFYTLLAPLPGMGTEVETAGGPAARANYFNLIIQFIIGLAGVLAVIMIVIGGFQYMLSDIPFSKKEAIGRIQGAIGGLILALGAALILQTLDPNILNLGLGNLGKVGLEVEPYQEFIPTDAAPPTGAIAQCKEGIVQITTTAGTINACSTIAEKVKNMINTANAATPKIPLFGGGFRTKAKQESLRADNCGGQANVYNKNAKCDPLTAYPGTSNHESGKALDLTCDGSAINLAIRREKTEKCFNWLKANAKDYGLKNLKSENWHWSVDGR